jgi:hypothetical protein
MLCPLLPKSVSSCETSLLAASLHLPPPQSPTFASFDVKRTNGDSPLLGIISLNLGGGSLSAASVDVVKLPTLAATTQALVTIRIQFASVATIAAGATSSPIQLTSNFLNRNTASSTVLGSFAVPGAGFMCPWVNADVLSVLGVSIGFSTVIPVVRTSGGVTTLELQNQGSSIASISAGTMLTCTLLTTAYTGSLA